METKKVSTITSNEDYVRMKELIQLAHSQMNHMRERANEIVDSWDKAIMAAKEEEREAIAVFCAAQAPTVVGELFAAAIRKRGEV